MQRPRLITVTALLMALTIVMELIWPLANFTMASRPAGVDPHWFHTYAIGIAIISALFVFYYWKGRTWARTLVLLNCVYRIFVVCLIFPLERGSLSPRDNSILAGLAIYQVVLALFLLIYLNTRRVLLWFADEPAFAELTSMPAPDAAFTMPVLSAQPEQPERDPERGEELKRRGIILIVFGVLAAFVLGAIFHAVDVGAWVEWLSFALMAFGVKYYLKGKRHLAVSVQQAMADDPRPPVLYLRSFGADKAAAKIPTGGLLRRVFGISGSPFDLQTEEELLAEVLSKIGPVVCIGKPGEELPELGATRFYVSHEEWQQTVHDFMMVSKLVVLRLGDTPGFWWEVERAVKTIDPTRLVFIVPFGKSKYQNFIKKGQAHFPQPLPAYKSGGFLGIRYTRSLGTLRGFIYFKPDWTPVYVDLVPVKPPLRLKPRFIGRRRLIKKLLWGMRPVFQQSGVAWTAPQVRPWLTTFALLFACVPVALIGFAVYSSLPGWLQYARYNQAESAYISRIQQSPEIAQAHGVLTPQQAKALGVELSRKGLLRLDDRQLIQRVALYGNALNATTSGKACADIVSTNVETESFEESLKVLPPIQIQAWFRIQGDAAIAEAKQDPPAVAVTAKELPAVYKALKDPHGPDENGVSKDALGNKTTFWLLGSNVTDPDARQLFSALGQQPSGNCHSDYYGGPQYCEYSATTDDVCRAGKALQTAVLEASPPENGLAARVVVLAEK